jgi:outer membrane biosynthesis protein TonB
MAQSDQFDMREKQTFFGRFGFAIGILAMVGVGIGLFSKMFSGGEKTPPRKAQEMVMIKPVAPPPPTPPPPPPPPQNEPKEQMMEQAPVDEAEAKPEAVADASPAIGTNIAGNGPADAFGLGKNTRGGLGGNGGGGKAGSRFGWYANQVIKSISDALGKNPGTRNASFNIKVKIWADGGGRITRAKLVELTGDQDVDEAIRNGVLTGHQLQEPPPEGMPMPIVMRLSARRPN